MPEVPKRKENGALGYFYYILYTIFSACGFVTAKLSYAKYPDLHPFQFIFLRSCWATLMVFVLLNRNFYKITVKDVQRSNVPPLAFRSIQGTIVNIINFTCSKYLPLSIIGIINNLTPVVTVGLAYVFLGERLKLIEITFLLLSVCAILTIIIGGLGQNSD